MNLQADRLKRIKPSMPVAINVKANALRAEGRDVLVLAAGEPDFNTPKNIRNAAKQAMERGETKYTAGSGTIELREAVCQKVKRENELTISPDSVLISNGEKQSLSLVCQTLFQQDDEVVIFKPYWVSFPEFVALADAKPLFVNTKSQQNFEPDKVEIESNKGFTLSLELTAKAHRFNYKIIEIPTTWIERGKGQSRFKLISFILPYAKWLFYIIKTSIFYRHAK